MRTGIYGGSFDPIHSGHVAAAEAVLHRRALDRLFFVPAASPPHKPGGCEASFEDRVAMARLAAAPEHGLDVLDIEGEREGPSYTVDTLRAFQAAHPEDHLELLVGADMLDDFPNWREPGAILELVQLVAFARPGAVLGPGQQRFTAAFGEGRAAIVEIPAISVSSTEVRARLRKSKSITDLVPKAVEAYIRERHLYRGLTRNGTKG